MILNHFSKPDEAYKSRTKETHHGDQYHHDPRGQGIEARAREEKTCTENSSEKSRSSQSKISEEEMKPIHKILLGILAVVAVGFIVAYLYPSTPSHSGKLTKRETNVVQAKIDKEHQRAKADTLASAALTGQAKQAVAAAQGTRKQALEFHKRSKSHASPVPTTAAGIDSLQSFFSTYGDRPADER